MYTTQIKAEIPSFRKWIEANHTVPSIYPCLILVPMLSTSKDRPSIGLYEVSRNSILPATLEDLLFALESFYLINQKEVLLVGTHG